MVAVLCHFCACHKNGGITERVSCSSNVFLSCSCIDFVEFCSFSFPLFKRK